MSGKQSHKKTPDSKARPIGIDLHLSLGIRRGVPSRASFLKWIEAALRAAKKRRGQLNIRVMDTEEARALNRDFRGRDYATNVLSFPGDAAFLGDIAICSEVVVREAIEQGKAARDHYAHLTIHGVLHLLGYDHENETDAQAMESLEAKALARMGIANPYL